MATFQVFSLLDLPQALIIGSRSAPRVCVVDIQLRRRRGEQPHSNSGHGMAVPEAAGNANGMSRHRNHGDGAAGTHTYRSRTAADIGPLPPTSDRRRPPPTATDISEPQSPTSDRAARTIDAAQPGRIAPCPPRV